MKIFLSLFCLLYAVEGYMFANKTKLYKDLFKNYEKKFRPGENQVIPTELNFSFYIRSINELQQSSGEMGVVGSLGVDWKDFRLAWNPSDYGSDLNQTSVFVDDIWTPYLVLMNPYEEINPILSGGFSCEVWYNGYVTCLPPPNIFKAFCIADVRFYPYDSKVCTLQLYISGYQSSDLNVQPGSQTFNREMYASDGVWSLYQTSIVFHTINIKKKSVKILELNIKVQRNSDKHVWDLFPILILNFIQLFVFILPNETGERIGFSVTVFLAEVVFLTVIQEKIPEASSSGTSYLVYKQLADLLTSLFTLLIVVITSVYYNKANTEKPEETKETPGKMNSVDSRKETDKANIEEPEETEKMPSEMNSVGIRRQTKGPTFWRNVGRRTNFILFFPCAVAALVNNVLFFWEMTAFE